jgi:hypothetical protein
MEPSPQGFTHADGLCTGDLLEEIAVLWLELKTGYPHAVLVLALLAVHEGLPWLGAVIRVFRESDRQFASDEQGPLLLELCEDDGASVCKKRGLLTNLPMRMVVSKRAHTRVCKRVYKQTIKHAILIT